MTWRLSLVRHGEIHRRWKNHCYGGADVGLSNAGRAQSRALAKSLASEEIDEIWSSDLKRARFLADRLGAHCDLPVKTTSALREREFGSWEKRPWDEIYREVGDEMEGMVKAPDRWHPPGGETTYQVRDRALDWFEGLGSKQAKPRHIVAVCHSGPIAALLGTLADEPVAGWSKFVPKVGTRLLLERHEANHSLIIPYARRED